MKNILFLTGTYPDFGGVEKVTTILANSFYEKGHKVSIASFEQPHPELLSELNDAIKLYKLKYPVRKNKKTLRNIIIRNNINIIINQWCVPFYVTKLCKDAAAGLNVKILSVHHNLPNTNFRIKNIEIAISRYEGNKIINQLKLWFTTLASRISLRLSYDNSDKYIVLAPRFIPIAEQFIHVKNSKKIISIFNPITCPPAQFIPNKKKEIIYVGRIEDNQKRTYRLLEVWEQLYKLHSDWVLTIVGDGPNRKDLERKIKERKLKNVFIEGFKDPTTYYQRASVLLLLSEYEGFPLVIGEAMNYSVIPVVLGSFDAIYDILTSGKDGIILQTPYDCNRCVEAMNEILNDDIKRNNMSHSAWTSSKRFSLPFIIDEWECLFKD